jgi:enamine deaminase RidA (YjgF/YER057c/UK114 family)
LYPAGIAKSAADTFVSIDNTSCVDVIVFVFCSTGWGFGATLDFVVAATGPPPGAGVPYSNVALRSRILFLAMTVAVCLVSPGSRAAAPVSRPVVSAGGLIYVSGITSPADSTPAAGGAAGSASAAEVTRQTEAVLDELRRDLTPVGSSLADVVSVTVYLKRSLDFDAMNAAYRPYFPESPPTRTTVAVDLPSGVLIQVSAIAVPTGTSRIAMLPANWAKSPRPYSYMVRSGDLVFFSGLVSRRGTDDQVVPGSVTVQTRTILDNASTLLRTAGLTFDNVVAARVFLTDDSDFEDMNAEYRKRFSGLPPARATAITGLMGGDAMVEISLIASSLTKEVIGPLVSPTLPVSTAVRAGTRVFVSGVTGTTDTNAEDAAGQTTEALGHLSHALSLAGLSPVDVVDATVYEPRLSDGPTIDGIYGAFFGSEPPARTVAGARLVSHTGLVEIMAMAVGKAAGSR